VATILAKRDGAVAVVLEINANTLEDDVKKLRALATPARLIIIAELAKAPRTMGEIHNGLKRQGLHRYPESTYKALEAMFQVGILNKTYDRERKRLVYSLSGKE